MALDHSVRLRSQKLPLILFYGVKSLVSGINSINKTEVMFLKKMAFITSVCSCCNNTVFIAAVVGDRQIAENSI